MGFSDYNHPEHELPDERNGYFAFCGLGNPENFFGQLRLEGFELAEAKAFRDHHVYRQRDIEDLESEARAAGGTALLTTPKDAVKLKNLQFELPCFVVESELKIEQEKKLHDLIHAAL